LGGIAHPLKGLCCYTSADYLDIIFEGQSLCDQVQSSIALSHLANLSAQSVGGVFTSVDTLLVDMSNVDLHAGVVLGGDQRISGRALAGDVQVNFLVLGVLHLER